MCPKDKLFKGYIALELKLFEFARCRTLYEKFIGANAANGAVWIKFAELERGLDDAERARAIFELAVGQEVLDMPELVWKAYIDFEEEEGEFERVRGLYARLLAKTGHVKVWISRAHFEINVPDEEEGDEGGEGGDGEEEERPVSVAAKQRARKVFDEGYASMKEQGLKEERVALLNAWKSFEGTHGEAADQEKVEKMMPRRVKKRRRVVGEDGESFEEFVDFVFPADDESAARTSRFLEMAAKWKEGGGKVG